jgi:hypothetical protein
MTHPAVEASSVSAAASTASAALSGTTPKARARSVGVAAIAIIGLPLVSSSSAFLTAKFDCVPFAWCLRWFLLETPHLHTGELSAGVHHNAWHGFGTANARVLACCTKPGEFGTSVGCIIAVIAHLTDRVFSLTGLRTYGGLAWLWNQRRLVFLFFSLFSHYSRL